MVLTEEQLRRVVKKVEDCLRSSNIYSQVKTSLKEIFDENDEVEIGSEVLNEVANAIDSRLGISSSENDIFDPDSLYLQVVLVDGRAFTSQLVDQEVKQNYSSFQAHLQFNGQRMKSRPVAAAVEPSFHDQTFTFRLGPIPNDMAGWLELVDKDMVLHLCITQARARSRKGGPGISSPVGTAKQELLASAVVDWRKSLVIGEDEISMVELVGSGPDSGFNEQAGLAGLLQIKLGVAFSPYVDENKLGNGMPLEVAQVERIISLKETAQIQAKRHFYLYAKGWWEEYTEVSEVFARRKLKLFAEDERGAQRSVCSYVWPCRAGRLFDTPHHAARFVSLIPFQRLYDLGGRLLDNWCSFPALLARGSGDAADHALLLCSLLLGFGLNAFVALGTAAHEEPDDNAQFRGKRQAGHPNLKPAAETSHTWVITLKSGAENPQVLFWESLTGARFPVAQKPGSKKQKAHHFRTISCIFNHERLFANKQLDERVEMCSYDLENGALWKSMNEQRILSIPHELTDLVIFPSNLDAQQSAELAEENLKALVTDYREGLGYWTTWDEELAYVIQPALTAYETDRIAGITYGNDFFQDALKRVVPDGHCFKGFPLFVPHLDCDKIFTKLMHMTVSKDVIDTHGDHVRFSLRVKVFAYPEETVSVWVMIAVRFQPVVGL